MTGGVLSEVGIELAVIALGFVVAFAVARYTNADAKRRALPTWAELLVAGIAMSPFVAHTEGLLPATIVDDTTLMTALLFVFWAVLPPIAYRILDPDPSETGTTC